MPASKYCFWLQCRAFFAPRASSAEMSVCITATILLISYTICCFLCAFHASSAFFYKISPYFLKICSPPSVGSMILKAAQKQNHEKCASLALQFCLYAPLLHHLLQPEICKIQWKNAYFPFIAPFRKLPLASSALSHGSELKFPLFCIASGLILCKNARRTRYFKSESSCNTCFGSPTYKQINTISVLFPAVQAVTISSSCNRRLLIACFPLPIGNCMQSINWWAAVCPPQRAFNNPPKNKEK